MDVPQGSMAHEGDTDEEGASQATIRLLDRPDDLEAVVVLLQQIWGSSQPLVGLELLRAITHAGGYVAGAFEADSHHERLIGASVGFLGRHDGGTSLHSHITGVLAGARSLGLGRAMKYHQRDWCADHSVDWVTWTFDPLVGRNAWFNIEILGVEIAEYLIDFYGQMHDAVNAGDESDRLLAAWRVDGATSAPPPDDWGEVRVPVSDNIVGLRRTDPTAAERERQRVRVELGDRMKAGARITGFTRDGEYVVRVPT